MLPAVVCTDGTHQVSKLPRSGDSEELHCKYENPNLSLGLQIFNFVDSIQTLFILSISVFYGNNYILC